MSAKSESFGLIERSSWLAELNHAWLQVVQGTFDEHTLLFVMGEEMMPESVLHDGGEMLVPTA